MYNLEEKSDDELYELLEKYEKLLKFASIYGGKVAIDDETITEQELNEAVREIKIEIAVRESN